MSDTPWSGNETLPPDLAIRVDAVCLRFENEWQAGKRPQIEDFLKNIRAEEVGAFLHELIPLETDYRRMVGEEPQAADYQARFPELNPSSLPQLLLRPTPERQRGSLPPDSLATRPSVPVIPDYDLLHRIGRGGFGEVWLGRNYHTGLFHAVKIIPADKAVELEGIRAYKNQTQDHPNLVPIEHVGQSGPWIYYTMPLADDT